MSAPTPDFALTYRDMMLDGFAREVETTKRVLAGVPDGKKDYRPDPCARTAWELAWHLANTDVQFLDGIADLKFTMANPGRKTSLRLSPRWWIGTTEISSAARIGFALCRLHSC